MIQLLTQTTWCDLWKTSASMVSLVVVSSMLISKRS